MKRRKRFIFLLVALFFALTLMSSRNVRASECWLMYFNWDCLNADPFDFDYKSWDQLHVSKHKDHSFQVEGFLYGSWLEWGSSFLINIPDGGCKPLYYGTKKQGFMICRDGSAKDKFPGCWFWKKVKTKECWWINE